MDLVEDKASSLLKKETYQFIDELEFPLIDLDISIDKEEYETQSFRQEVVQRSHFDSFDINLQLTSLAPVIEMQNQRLDEQQECWYDLD